MGPCSNLSTRLVLLGSHVHTYIYTMWTSESSDGWLCQSTRFHSKPWRQAAAVQQAQLSFLHTLPHLPPTHKHRPRGRPRDRPAQFSASSSGLLLQEPARTKETEAEKRIQRAAEQELALKRVSRFLWLSSSLINLEFPSDRFRRIHGKSWIYILKEN